MTSSSPGRSLLASQPGEVPAPLYMRVKQTIISQIQPGAWPPHHRVPSESELVNQFGFSHMTINHTLRELTSDNLLVRMQRVGTFVAEPKGQSALLEVHNVADEIATRGHRHRYQVITLGEEVVGPECILVLDVCEGQRVFHSLIVHHGNNIPVQIGDRYVNAAVAPDYLEQDLAR